MLIYKRFIYCLLIIALPLTAERSNEEVFTEIYKNKVWGANKNGAGSSGGGSTLATTELYRQFLQDFFKAYNIHSVVDVGCGDWEFSKAVNWDGINYLGYDVVGPVIARNKAKYSTKTIGFVHDDAINIDLPKADLLICKDVLQHLPNQDIQKLINQISKYKYCLITNDIDPSTMSSDNPQIERGGYRALDLTKPPFYLEGVKIFTYVSGPTLKQVLLICR